MSESKIKLFLSNIFYPNLSKNIIELGLVENIEKKDNNLNIMLAISNDDAFNKIKQEIENSQLSNEFNQIEVNQKKSIQKKSINYGHTANPNNRATYAKKVIAVTSGKGGVGKSTVSVNLAVSLAQDGYRVGVLDADVYGPNIPRMFGVENEKLTWNDKNKIVPSVNFGVKIMSVALTTPRADTPLVWRSSVAVSALIQFLEDVDWGELDFLVIDMPPGTGDIQLTMAQELPISAAVIVTTPQTIALDDVSRAIMMFKETGVRIGGLVENMSYFIAPDTGNRYDIFGNGGGEEICVKYDIPFLGAIPLDIAVRINSDNGLPSVASKDQKLRSFYKQITNNLMKLFI